jgi:hypothetical protein
VGEEAVPDWRPQGIPLVLLCFLCMMICSLDRVAMSVCLLPMALEFG